MDNAALLLILAVACFVFGWTAAAVVLAFAAGLVAVLWSLRILAGLLITPPRRR